MIYEMVEHLAHWLPAQGPIKDFIHHNTLHAYQNRPFHEAIRVASLMYGSKKYLPLEEYRSFYHHGRISPTALEWALRRYSGGSISLEALRKKMFTTQETPLPPGVAALGLRSRWRTRYHLDPNLHVHPLLFRLVGQYLDQGIAIWRMPHSSGGFFESVATLVEQSFLPLPLLSGPSARELLKLGPERALERVLSKFLANPAHWPRYLTEVALSHPGWSGMVRQLEIRPESVLERRPITLLEFLALELILEFSLVERRLGSVPQIADQQEPPLLIPAEGPSPLVREEEQIHEIWHEAYEGSQIEMLLQRLSGTGSSPFTAPPEAQVFFCIDDRECSLRRHLETQYPAVETFGTAGFFSVDCAFQGAFEVHPSKHCPVPVVPRHLIRERLESAPSEDSASVERALHPTSNTMVRGMLIGQAFGLEAAFKMAVSLLRPSLEPPIASSLRKMHSQADLMVFAEERTHEGEYQLGYLPQEMADRVGSLLTNAGAVTTGIADLVLILGHGASSVNNPYFSAYDCGACSGKAGAANARAFAKMANHPEVRKILKERGILISEGVWFLGAIHDTTRDEILYFDTEELPQHLEARFHTLQSAFEMAIQSNAKERGLKFEQMDQDLDPEAALREVRLRSVSFFEPRPELNHATNAICIVGRRALTRGRSFDRRAFLNSYDPSIDPSGTILSSILSAVVPVCGGISLEYFFSRVDPGVYGAGSKLSHNVVGLLGVSNGTEGDLLPGLPTQMTELHDPVRLVILVEQTPEIALQAAGRNPSIFEWIQMGWVRYLCRSPWNRQIYEFFDGQMIPLELGVR